ncbi:methyl jasmonate esterase 1-like [Humulus lupulus]|uniref:methyl jasmonate esterase 1-like n=1 Tax=Humulus lupulus TaxID=3486 RepID=UPI002B40AE34|nr:methyl jasmonate esterase 1-like [Humulus lupulus]
MMERKVLVLLSFVVIVFIVETSNGKSEATKTGKHFVLVHGSCHGAWSWYKLVALIKSSGHKVTALDLASSGVDPRRANEVRFMSDYFRPLMDFMAGLRLRENERVVMVGHSLGGLTISKAMEDFPSMIDVAIFLTALMPGPSLNVSTLYQESLKITDDQMDNNYIYDNGPNNPPTAFIFGQSFLASKVYQRSSYEDLELAIMLMRPLPLFNDENMSKELVLSEDKYGSVDRVYIISENDKVMNKDVERWMLKNNQPNHVVTIKGSDHMVMMSNSISLWSHLQNITKEYN